MYSSIFDILIPAIIILSDAHVSIYLSFYPAWLRDKW